VQNIQLMSSESAYLLLLLFVLLLLVLLLLILFGLHLFLWRAMGITR